MTDMMGAGHRYNKDTGTGIELVGKTARLYQGGEVVATGTHKAASPWEFWHSLAFADVFPAVTHWWFGSAWTGQVRFTLPSDEMDGTTFGTMQFVDEDQPAIPWALMPGFRVAPPMPPLHVTPLNLPLRRQLAELILAPIVHHSLAKSDDPARIDQIVSAFYVDIDLVQAEQWLGITSLVERDRLAEMFPTTPLWWTLEPLQGSFRDALCALQGLERA